MKDILKRIIFGAEVTVTKRWTDHMHFIREAQLNKYQSSYKFVDYEFIKCLIQMEIIEESGGNFETHERHYVLNDKFLSYKDIRCIEFGKIEKCILLYNHPYPFKSVSDDCLSIKIEKIFFELKNKLLRKEKLKKINDSILH